MVRLSRKGGGKNIENANRKEGNGLRHKCDKNCFFSESKCTKNYTKSI